MMILIMMMMMMMLKMMKLTFTCALKPTMIQFHKDLKKCLNFVSKL